MITNIKSKTINGVVLGSIEALKNEGFRTPSRNGDQYAIYNALLTLENPRSRHLDLKGRKNNIFATIAETFWVYSGSIRVDGFLEFFLPRARDFTDNGIEWYGGYGKRLFIYNQLDDVIQQFRNEGIFTRRANLYIGQPEFDAYQQLEVNLGKYETKDRPCNQLFNFFITPDKKLNMNGFSRSGDIIWGIGSINLFEFSYLQEFILQELQREIDPEITLGEYNHFITNMHLYDFNGQQGLDVLELKDEQDILTENEKVLKFPKGVDNFKNFHKVIVTILSKHIKNGTTNVNSIYKDIFSELSTIFKWDPKDNLMIDYLIVVCTFVATKNAGLKGNKRLDLKLEDLNDSKEFFNSIKNSVFRKFTLDKVDEKDIEIIKAED
jgi:hypothetical protein